MTIGTERPSKPPLARYPIDPSEGDRVSARSSAVAPSAVPQGSGERGRGRRSRGYLSKVSLGKTAQLNIIPERAEEVFVERVALEVVVPCGLGSRVSPSTQRNLHLFSHRFRSDQLCDVPGEGAATRSLLVLDLSKRCILRRTCFCPGRSRRATSRFLVAARMSHGVCQERDSGARYEKHDCEDPTSPHFLTFLTSSPRANLTICPTHYPP